MANTLRLLGHLHVALGHIDQARTVWQEALKIYQAQQRTGAADHVQQQLDTLAGANPARG